MSRSIDVVEDAILRLLVVAGGAVVLGYLVFGLAVFNMRMIWFEYVANSVTVAIAYMSFRSPRVRNGFVLLLFWYLFLIAFVFVPHNGWMPIMEASYVVGLTAAIYVFFLLDRRHIVKSWVQRIVCVALLIGFTHALVVLFLQVLTRSMFVHPLESLGWSFINLKNGVVIGLLCAIGMELSEYIINSRFLHRSVSG